MNDKLQKANLSREAFNKAYKAWADIPRGPMPVDDNKPSAVRSIERRQKMDIMKAAFKEWAEDIKALNAGFNQTDKQMPEAIKQINEAFKKAGEAIKKIDLNT